VLTYVMLGWGLNIVVGLAGLLDLGYVAFYAVGAYSYALLATNFGLSFWICLPLAGILAAFWGVLLGFPVLRLRGDYLAIVTLAFGEIIRLVLINWQSVDRRPERHLRHPAPVLLRHALQHSEPDGFAGFFGIAFSPVHRMIFLFYLILALALLTNWVTIRLRKLPIGRAWEALREDEIACRSLGINVTINDQAHRLRDRRDVRRLRRLVLRHPAGLHQPGILHLHRIGDHPRHRRARRHGQPARRRARGGGDDRRLRGTVPRPSIQYRMLVFGLAMVLIMIWKPRGLVSRAPTVFLDANRAVSADLVKEGHG
jgi:branched-chain amino acid transport system permease protein